MSDDRYRISREGNEWRVYRLGEHARYVRGFPSYGEAENYVLTGRVLTAEERVARNAHTAAVVNRLLDFHGDGR